MIFEALYPFCSTKLLLGPWFSFSPSESTPGWPVGWSFLGFVYGGISQRSFPHCRGRRKIIQLNTQNLEPFVSKKKIDWIL